ncbi:MAG TPA: hypothetical protein P5210_12810 [Draconibacterium sp.]|nr:hypothetical protein [Draconibacterium sp.]HRX12530.1 hypothetical protein [Draconibacterium sp.]
MSEIKIFSLLPSWCRFLGAALMILGLVATYYFIFLSIKPEWLQFNVFTVYSKYLETTTFSFINNNQGDEIAVFSYLAGFLILLFSSNKKQSEFISSLKVKALVNTIVLSVILFIATYFFIHGMPVLYLVVLYAYSIPLMFVLIYLFLRLTNHTKFAK